MDAGEYLNFARGHGQIIRVAIFEGEEIVGRREALIVDRDKQIAVVLEGWNKNSKELVAGAVVKYYRHPEAPDGEFKVSGTPAYFRNPLRELQ